MKRIEITTEEAAAIEAGNTVLIDLMKRLAEENGGTDYCQISCFISAGVLASGHTYLNYTMFANPGHLQGDPGTTVEKAMDSLIEESSAFEPIKLASARAEVARLEKLQSEQNNP